MAWVTDGDTVSRMAADDVVRANLTVLASPPFASMLVQMLREEGVTVEWDPPEERRGAGEVVQQVVISILAAGAYDGIKLAVQRFVERTNGRAKVDIKVEGPPRHAR